LEKAVTVLERLIELDRQKHPINLQLVTYLSDTARDGNLDQVSNYAPDSIAVTAKGRPIKSKTFGQRQYVQAIRDSEITFSIGPAGTGKTFLAVAMAVNAFRSHEVSRIILTRPAVEAGEKLGFLPGDLQNKVDPYMRPLYDALHELMGAEQYLKNLEKGLIEVSPLAYMRGRTLDEAFIILDEAQNTTPEQMKMFLTRLGFNSRAVITGDITQIDLPGDKKSGLKEARKILHGVEGLSFVELTQRDVVRNPLVQRIIKAYELDHHKVKESGRE
jgi:phosphate starvation-inducible PhoH-like protein